MATGDNLNAVNWEPNRSRFILSAFILSLNHAMSTTDDQTERIVWCLGLSKPKNALTADHVNANRDKRRVGRQVDAIQ
jgi:hypothetical protein